MEGAPQPIPAGIESSVNSEALDARWFGVFSESMGYAAEDAYRLDKDTQLEQKRKFMNGETLNPELSYPNLDRTQIDADEARLVGLKREMLSEEKNPVVLQAYRWRINERIAELRMFRATLDGDMRRFSRYNDFIYGQPSLEAYYLTVNEIRKRLSKVFKGEPKLDNARRLGVEGEVRGILKDIGSKEYDQEIVRTAEELDDLLPLPVNKSEFPESPSKNTVKAVQEIVEGEMEGLGLTREDREHGAVMVVNGKELPMDKTTPFSALWVKDLFEGALQSLGANGWQVVLRDDIGAINVSQGKKTVEVPNSGLLGSEDVERVLGHEILRHVGRRVHGERSRLSLLGLGLDRYIKGEEGVTKVTEHALKGKFLTYGAPELPLAIALAKGVDGEPRDFREVYNILEKIFILKQVKNGKYNSFDVEEAKEKAWNHCMRVFRGTDGKTPGVALSKDLVYREGSIAVWDVVKKDTNEVYKFSIGKYDQTNPRHIWILSQLGILDSDLEELEK